MGLTGESMGGEGDSKETVGMGDRAGERDGERAGEFCGEADNGDLAGESKSWELFLFWSPPVDDFLGESNEEI